MADPTILSSEQPLVTSDFLYRKNRILARIFCAHPAKVWFAFSMSSLICLVIPAWWLNLLFITDASKNPVRYLGFMQSFNWAVMYTVVLPAIFAGAAALSRATTHQFQRLVTDLNLVVKDDGTPATDFPVYVATEVARYSHRLVITCVGIALLLVFADTYDLARGITSCAHTRSGVCSYPFKVKDWTVAFALDKQYLFAGPTAFHPSIRENLLFDSVAYAFEASVIFLGFFFLFKFWTVLKIFTDVLRESGNGYNFQPWWDDPSGRMGLRGMGNLFNTFLAMTLAFQVYILGLRLELIDRLAEPFWSYLTKIAEQTKNLTNLQRLWDLRAFEAINTGMFLLLTVGTLPIITIAWVPLFRLRPYLSKVRDEQETELMHAMGKVTQESAEGQKLRKRDDQVRKACMWPNGDASGWLFMVAMLVIACTAILPPLFAYFLGCGVLTLLVKWIPIPGKAAESEKKSSGREKAE
jgi:hypothetical protein